MLIKPGMEIVLSSFILLSLQVALIKFKTWFQKRK